MTEQKLKLTRRRFLGGLLTVGGASAAAGAGTMAQVSDTESSSGNDIQAGTLDLKLDGADQTVSFLYLRGIEPGDEGSQTVKVENTGKTPGRLEVDLISKSYHENGISGNEQKVDNSSDTAELQKYLDVRATISSNKVWDRQRVKDLDVKTYQTSTTLDASSGEKTFTVEWWFADPGTETVYEAESDSVELDLTFRLDQQ